MIIDFHTHIFPDDIAKRAIDSLFKMAGGLYNPVNDGTASGLINNMDKWGINISVVQPVITKFTQTEKVNEWAADMCSERLICFGGVYPHTDDYKRDIDFVVSLGLKGIKLHPEYQDFVLDDKHMLKLYDYALSKGLILLFHAGFDIGYCPPFKSSPKQFKTVVDIMAGGVVVAAHLGGCRQWDDVYAYLAGSNIYLDTSMGFDYYTKEQFLNIFYKHGADRILFASDSPWSSAENEINHLNMPELSEADRNAVLGGNAARILGIPSNCSA